MNATIKILFAALACLLPNIMQDTRVPTSTPSEQSAYTRRSIILGGVSWSPDGSQIAVGTDDGVFIHQADDLSRVYQFNEARVVTALDWHPVNNWIATGHGASSEEPTRVWDVVTGEVLYSFESELIVKEVRWSPDGRFLASTGNDAIIHILDVRSGVEVQRIAVPPLVYSGLLSWGQDSQRLVTFHATTLTDYGLYIYDINSGEADVSWPFDISTPSLAWSPDGATIATYSLDNQLRLWDADNGGLLDQIQMYASGWSGYGMTWSPDGTKIVLHISTCIANTSCNRSDDRLQLIDVETGMVIAQSSEILMSGDGFYQNAIEYSPDGTRIATVSDDGRLFILAANDLTELAVYDDYQPIYPPSVYSR